MECRATGSGGKLPSLFRQMPQVSWAGTKVFPHPPHFFPQIFPKFVAPQTKSVSPRSFPRQEKKIAAITNQRTPPRADAPGNKPLNKNE